MRPLLRSIPHQKRPRCSKHTNKRVINVLCYGLCLRLTVHVYFCVARFRFMLYLSLCFAFHVYAGNLCFMFMLMRIVMSMLYVCVYACFMLMVHVIRRSCVCLTLRGHVLCSILIGRVDGCFMVFMFDALWFSVAGSAFRFAAICFVKRFLVRNGNEAKVVSLLIN